MYDNIPAELRQLEQWCNWTEELRDGKKTKVPLIAQLRLAYAKSNDPSTWRSFDTALTFDFSRICRKSEYATGMGFMLASGYFGIDLDHALADAQIKHIEIQEILAHFRGAYIEVSPSGAGLHIIARGQVGAGRKIARPDGIHIEVYDHGRFFTMTGNVFSGPAAQEPLPDCQEGIDWLITTHFPDTAHSPSRHNTVRSTDSARDARTWRDIDIALRDNPEPPPRKMALIEHIEPRWRDTWERKIQMPDDNSLSGHDMALTRLMARNGWTPQEMCDTLRVFRASHGKLDKERRLDYFQRTIWKVLEDLYEDAVDDDAAHPLPLPSNNTPDTALILHLTGLDVVRYIQTGMAPAHYRVVLASGDVVHLGSAAHARNQGVWQTIAQERQGRPFRKLTSAQWEQFLDCLGTIVEREEAEGSSYMQSILDHLLVYSSMGVNSSEYEIVITGRPFTEDNDLYVSVSHLGSWLRRLGMPMEDNALVSTLKILGAEVQQIFRRAGHNTAAQAKRNYWKLPHPGRRAAEEIDEEFQK